MRPSSSSTWSSFVALSAVSSQGPAFLHKKTPSSTPLLPSASSSSFDGTATTAEASSSLEELKRGLLDPTADDDDDDGEKGGRLLRPFSFLGPGFPPSKEVLLEGGTSPFSTFAAEVRKPRRHHSQRPQHQHQQQQRRRRRAIVLVLLFVVGVGLLLFLGTSTALVKLELGDEDAGLVGLGGLRSTRISTSSGGGGGGGKSGRQGEKEGGRRPSSSSSAGSPTTSSWTTNDDEGVDDDVGENDRDRDDGSRDGVVQPGGPHRTLKAALVPGKRYATTAPGAGLSNQIIGIVELLRFSQLANRVPIVPDFVSYPIIDHGPDWPSRRLNFETVFDLERYTRETGQQTTTFGALKVSRPEKEEEEDAVTAAVAAAAAGQTAPLPTPLVEHLPCFSTTHRDRRSILTPTIVDSSALAIDWTPHRDVRLDVWPGPLDVAFSEPLAMEELVAFSEGPAKAWEGWVDSVVEKLEDDGAKALAEGARPEQDLVCWSELYWASEKAVHPFAERWGANWPAWQSAGRHLHFAPTLKAQAEAYLAHLLGDAQRPFIAIHARHGDFGCSSPTGSGRPGRPELAPPCFRPASTYLPAVSHLRTSLSELKQTAVGPRDVVVFSDETDQAWWDGVAELGWKRADHHALGTSARWDNWYPTLLDGVMMASAKGFIGTPGSTYSLFAALRVRDWNDGLALEEPR